MLRSEPRRLTKSSARSTLQEWRRHRSEPWRFALEESLRRAEVDQSPDDRLLKAAEALAWREEDDEIAANDAWSPLLNAAAVLAWREGRHQ